MKLHVSTWGSTDLPRTAVLLHGVTSNSQSWVRVGPALAHLEPGYRSYAPDLRGHGMSPKSDSRYQLERMVRDLVDNLPVAPDLLIGHSFGGVLAILASARRRLQPSRLVLEDPVLVLPDQELPARLLATDEASLPRDVEGTLRANPRWTREDAEGKVASLRDLNWNHMRQVFADNAPWDLRTTLVEVAERIPTLLVLPESSFYVPVQDATMLEQRLGPDHIVRVPGTGHSVHRDDLNGFLDAITRWAQPAQGAETSRAG
jgi:pimeloyl-ACP methyl ester carboxylesterase